MVYSTLLSRMVQVFFSLVCQPVLKCSLSPYLPNTGESRCMLKFVYYGLTSHLAIFQQCSGGILPNSRFLPVALLKLPSDIALPQLNTLQRGFCKTTVVPSVLVGTSHLHSVTKMQSKPLFLHQTDSNHDDRMNPVDFEVNSQGQNEQVLK